MGHDSQYTPMINGMAAMRAQVSSVGTVKNMAGAVTRAMVSRAYAV